MDKELLLQPRITEHEHEIPNVGTVRFRSLSREEAHSVVGTEIPKDVMERRILALAMVDPQLSESDVATWYANAPTGEFDPLLAAIMQASGITATFAKEAYQQFRDQSGSRVRVLPRREAGPDGVPVAHGDE